MPVNGKSPLIIGHRGASAVAPENTLAAFRQALSDGADGVEFDVRLSRDAVPVVIHDRSLNRTGDRANLVSSMTARELGKVDVGSWFNRRFRSRARDEYSKERTPTLEQVFETVGNSKVLLYVELKSDNSADEGLVREVVALINRYDLRELVVVESFTLANLQMVKQIDGRIRTAALFEPGRQPLSLLSGRRLIKQTLASHADEIALHRSSVNHRVVSAARDAGLSVVVWTVDTPSWIARAQRLGIKALITNRPDEMLRLRDSA